MTHPRFALDMLRDGVMRPRLVFDDSKLNDRRILVNWLSPNHWTIGYRYGTVRLAFALDGLLNGMKTYWVEVGDYEIKAPRILLSPNAYSASSGLLPYDPTIGDGPWWYDEATRTHYFNNNHCLELLVEREIEFSECSRLDFVSHNPRYCSINRTSPQDCRDLGRGSGDASRLFLASAVAHRLGGGAPIATSLARLMGQQQLGRSWDEIWRVVKGPFAGSRGPIAAGTSEASVAARAVLLALSQEDAGEMRAGLCLFRSDADAVEACANLIENALDLKGKTLDRS